MSTKLKIVVERGTDGHHVTHCPSLKGFEPSSKQKVLSVAR